MLPLPPTISLSFSSSSVFLRPLQPRRLRTSPSTLAKKSGVRSELATLPVLSFSGKKVGETFLDLKVAPPSTARAVVHRGLITDQQNARRGTASTLTRGEVRGGGKKPYPQKKTGRARRGSQRTPLRPGGGVVFGPKPRDWSIKINRKEKRLALSTAIASAADADALVVEDFVDQFRGAPKSRDFVAALRRWGLDPNKKSMFLMMEVPDKVRLSCRNIGTLKMLTPRTLNLFDVLNSEKLVFTKNSLDYLNAMYGNGGSSEQDDDEEEQALVAGNEDNVGDESLQAMKGSCVLLKLSITWLFRILISELRQHIILALLKLAPIENHYDVECPLSNIMYKYFCCYV